MTNPSVQWQTVNIKGLCRCKHRGGQKSLPQGNTIFVSDLKIPIGLFESCSTVSCSTGCYGRSNSGGHKSVNISLLISSAFLVQQLPSFILCQHKAPTGFVSFSSDICERLSHHLWVVWSADPAWDQLQSLPFHCSHTPDQWLLCHHLTCNTDISRTCDFLMRMGKKTNKKSLTHSSWV